MRALQPVPPPSGTGVAGYQVADYLDQHGRRTRQDQLGPASLWDALTAHAASAGDLTASGRPHETAACTATPQPYGQQRQLWAAPTLPASSSPTCGR